MPAPSLRAENPGLWEAELTLHLPHPSPEAEAATEGLLRSLAGTVYLLHKHYPEEEVVRLLGQLSSGMRDLAERFLRFAQSRALRDAREARAQRSAPAEPSPADAEAVDAFLKELSQQFGSDT